jgi:hypothetical protein
MSNTKIKLDLFDITFYYDDMEYFLINGLKIGNVEVTGDQIKTAIVNDDYRIMDNLEGITRADISAIVGIDPQPTVVELKQQISDLQTQSDNLEKALISSNVLTSAQIQTIKIDSSDRRS